MTSPRSHRPLLILACVVLALYPAVGVPRAASAATLTLVVNSSQDAHDATPGDGNCASSAGQCTLRAAIEEANAQTKGSTITIQVPAGTYGNTGGPGGPIQCGTPGGSPGNPGVGGGLLDSGGAATLAYVTVASNSDGLTIVNGAIALTGTIVASSTIGANCSGTVTESQGYNLDSGASCGFGQSTDLTNTDPLLRPLAANGGSTLTMALQSGSKAIDHGGTSADGCPAADQRGLPRPDENGDSGACDMGAYESQGVG